MANRSAPACPFLPTLMSTYAGHRRAAPVLCRCCQLAFSRVLWPGVGQVRAEGLLTPPRRPPAPPPPPPVGAFSLSSLRSCQACPVALPLPQPFKLPSLGVLLSACRDASFHFWDATDDITGASLDLLFERDRLYLHNAAGSFGAVPMTLTGG